MITNSREGEETEQVHLARNQDRLQRRRQDTRVSDRRLFIYILSCGVSSLLPERLQHGVHEARVAQVAQTDDAHLLGPLGGRLQLLLLVLQNAPDQFALAQLLALAVIAHQLTAHARSHRRRLAHTS
jgi:hypothetical protein